MTKATPERKNDFAVVPHAINIVPQDPNGSKSVSPHATNVIPPERQVQGDGNNGQ